MSKAIKSIITIFFCVGSVYAQTNFQKFGQLVSKGDTIGQIKLLKQWEKENIDDPELYVSYFNYYATLSESEVLELGSSPKGER